MTPLLDDETAAGLEYSHDLAQRVQREADEACRLPWWFWEAAIAIFILSIAGSAAFPWGFAS